jgi:hypothetical protein
LPFSSTALAFDPDLDGLDFFAGGSIDLRSFTSSRTGSVVSSPDASLELGWMTSAGASLGRVGARLRLGAMFVF